MSRPPSRPTNVRATLGIGNATVTWDAPEVNKDSGPIIGYTVVSRVFGENQNRSHKPPLTGLVSRVLHTDAATNDIGPYATNKCIFVEDTTVTIRELSESRSYAFRVIAHNQKFTSVPSVWSESIRPAPKSASDCADNLRHARKKIEHLHQGQHSYQGSYFLVKDKPTGWEWDVLRSLREHLLEDLETALQLDSVDIDTQIQYDRNVSREHRVFRYGRLQLGAFDGISDLDKVAVTGDTLLMLAIKLGDVHATQTILARKPSLAVRNMKHKSAIDVAQLMGCQFVSILQDAAFAIDAPTEISPGHLCFDSLDHQIVTHDIQALTEMGVAKIAEQQRIGPAENCNNNGTQISVHAMLQGSSAWRGW